MSIDRDGLEDLPEWVVGQILEERMKPHRRGEELDHRDLLLAAILGEAEVARRAGSPAPASTAS